MLKLGENLKKLRLNGELTQEQLADILGVSPQAVSRWENGTTYPDITLLPAIACYFEITIDELMGMDDFISEEQLKELNKKLDENGSNGLIYENILLLRDAVKTYPTNYRLQLRLLNQLSFCQYRDGVGLEDDEVQALNREAVEVGKRILSRCNDIEIVSRTTYELSYIFSRLGEKEKAIEYAKELPNLGTCGTVVLGDIYEGEEQKVHLQLALRGYLSILWRDLRNMADLEYNDEKMTTAERIAILQKSLAIFDIVFENGDYLGYSDLVSMTHRYIASMAMLEDDYELAISSLENAAKYAVISDTLPDRAQHTSLLVNKINYDVHDTMKNYDFTNSKILYDKMQSDRYEPIRSHKRFIAVLDKISEYC